MKFATLVQYTPDAEAIAALRPQHRAYLGDLLESGQLLLAGPFADDSGALFVHEAADVAAARALVAADPFADGVFTAVETRPWKLVLSRPDALGLPHP